MAISTGTRLGPYEVASLIGAGGMGELYKARDTRLDRTTAHLTNNQYNVLRILRGSHPAKLACSDIAERMIDRDPDITRLIDRLETRGLVRRSRSRRDRRVVEVGITDKGLALVRGLDTHVQRMPKALLGHLGVERLRQLGSLLEAVILDLGTFP